MRNTATKNLDEEQDDDAATMTHSSRRSESPHVRGFYPPLLCGMIETSVMVLPG